MWKIFLDAAGNFLNVYILQYSSSRTFQFSIYSFYRSLKPSVFSGQCCYSEEDPGCKGI